LRESPRETRLSRPTRIMKWVSIAALVLAVLFRASSGYQTVMQFLVCAGAVLVVLQAGRTGRYAWAAGFSAIALLYNPIVPVALSLNMFLVLASLAMFALSVAVLKTQPARARLLLPRSKTKLSSGVTSVTWS